MIMEITNIFNKITFLEKRMSKLDQARWDKQLEIDSNARKLNFLINAGLEEHRTDNTKDI